jgi:hypothetical protein
MGTSMRNKLAVAAGATGALAAIVTTAVTPAFGSTAASPAPIRLTRNTGPAALQNGDTTLAQFQLPAGTWLITAKMWANSVPSQPTTSTVVGCHIGKGSTALDSSAFNVPKVGGAGGDGAGVNVDDAIVTLRSTTTIKFQCNDFGSQAVAHDITLSAVG